ncbi:MAG: hypothetical protein RR646_01090 [Erysipelotrichaceae bacterium]
MNLSMCYSDVKRERADKPVRGRAGVASLYVIVITSIIIIFIGGLNIYNYNVLMIIKDKNTKLLSEVYIVKHVFKQLHEEIYDKEILSYKETEYDVNYETDIAYIKIVNPNFQYNIKITYDFVLDCILKHEYY